MSKKPLEKDVISALISDKEKIDKVRDIVKKEHFSSPHTRWAYQKIIDYYDKYNDVPKKVGYFKVELAKNKDLDEEEKSRWFKLIRNIFRKSLDKSSSEYAIDEIISFAKGKEVLKILEKGIDQLDKGDWKEAIDTLHATIDVQTREKEYEIINWLKTWEERQEERKNKKENPNRSRRILLPWPSVNEVTRGIGPGESLSIASLTNVGKSIALINCGRRAFVDEKKVCHVVIEDTKEMVLQRYDSAILRVKYDDLKDFELDKETIQKLNGKIEKTRSLIGENLRVIKTKAKKTSVLTIYKALRELENEEFYPDVLIIDYADIMVPIRKGEQFRLEQADVYWEIKSLAEEKNIPIITATQVAKEYLKRKAYAEGLSEAYDKARILNVVLTLNQLDPESKDILMIIAKNRDGEKGREVPLISDYANMKLFQKP